MRMLLLALSSFQSNYKYRNFAVTMLDFSINIVNLSAVWTNPSAFWWKPQIRSIRCRTIQGGLPNIFKSLMITTFFVVHAWILLQCVPCIRLSLEMGTSCALGGGKQLYTSLLDKLFCSRSVWPTEFPNYCLSEADRRRLQTGTDVKKSTLSALVEAWYRDAEKQGKM